jgi:hypothetical protein
MSQSFHSDDPAPTPAPAPSKPLEFIEIPIWDAYEFCLNAKLDVQEPNTLEEALKRPDGDKYL